MAKHHYPIFPACTLILDVLNMEALRDAGCVAHMPQKDGVLMTLGVHAGWGYMLQVSCDEPGFYRVWAFCRRGMTVEPLLAQSVSEDLLDATVQRAALLRRALGRCVR